MIPVANQSFEYGTVLAERHDVSANLAVSTATSSLRATIAFGANESSHLYRGAASPSPIGIVLRSPFEPPLSTTALLTVLTSDGESYECRATLHWISSINYFEYWLGFRLLNPSRELQEALHRVASRFPTRLYDESPDTRATSDTDEACPCTLRTSPHRLNDSQIAAASGPFAVADSGNRVDFDELRRSGPGMCFAPDEDEVTLQ